VELNWGNFADQSANSNVYLADPNQQPGEKFEKFIDSLHASDRPVLYFLHTNLPHSPWQYLPTGKMYSSLALDGLYGRYEYWPSEPSASECAYQRHLLQVAYADMLFGKLVSKLTESGLYDKALIIVTADHGVSFRPGDARRGMTMTNYPDILWVPLMIKKPGQTEGRILDWNVESIDVLPTILDILDIQVPWEMAGSSLLDGPPRDRKMRTVLNVQFNKLIEFEADVRKREEAIARKYQMFGDDLPLNFIPNDSVNVWLGRDIRAFKIEPEGHTVQINYAKSFREVDIHSNYLPVFASGSVRVRKSDGERLNLGISVNGTIQAVTTSFPLTKGEEAFGAMIPEDSLINGTNKIESVRLPGQDGKPVIIPPRS
jgi:hypothetical protein